jgi:hypothetical protein
MKPISAYTDAKELRQLMKNAKKLGRDDVYWQSFNRLCALQGIDQSDPLHRDFYATLAAYEELLAVKNGRTTSASRTRQKLQNKGVIQCLEDWAVQTKATEGFELLVKNGLVELTGEFLVLKYPDQFSPKAVASAKARLEAINQ